MGLEMVYSSLFFKGRPQTLLLTFFLSTLSLMSDSLAVAGNGLSLMSDSSVPVGTGSASTGKVSAIVSEGSTLADKGFALAGFKSLLQKYQNNRGVKMAFHKQAYFPLLKKRTSSQGEFFLSQNKVRLDLQDPHNTQILFDGRKWWHIIAPAGEPKQVSAIQPDSNIAVLFQPEVFFKNFRFVLKKTKGRAQILHFKPQGKKAQLEALSVKIERDRILKVWLKWKGSGNEEVFSFSNIRFNQVLPKSLFSAT